MEMRGGRYPSYGAGHPGYLDIHPITITSPTCEELGIPAELGEEAGPLYPFLTRRILHSPSLHLEGLRYESDRPPANLNDPYSPLCMIPLPGALALHAAAEPSFIRKRNERERERVRCVNEGYERLKEHLPAVSKEKRLSKVETLRGAIEYIRQLRKLLDEAPPVTSSKDGHSPCSPAANENEAVASSHVSFPELSSEKVAKDSPAGHGQTRKASKRRSSLSSEQSAVSDGTLSESEDDHFLGKRSRLQ